MIAMSPNVRLVLAGLAVLFTGLYLQAAATSPQATGILTIVYAILALGLLVPTMRIRRHR